MAEPTNSPQPTEPNPAPIRPAAFRTCACGRVFDPSRAVYNEQGELICDACAATDTVQKGYYRAAHGAAHSALVAGIISIFCNPLFIPSIIATVSAISALIALYRKEYREQLPAGVHTRLVIEAILGLACAAFHPALGLLSFVLELLVSH